MPGRIWRKYYIYETPWKKKYVAAPIPLIGKGIKKVGVSTSWRSTLALKKWKKRKGL